MLPMMMVVVMSMSLLRIQSPNRPLTSSILASAVLTLLLFILLLVLLLLMATF
jgi:hypothetical protein